MKIVVFGGQGFIGSFLVDNLLEKGHKVMVFDRVHNQKMWEEYGWDEKNVEFMLGDIKDEDAVREAVNLCDRWVNLAGLLGTQEMMENPIPAVEVNIIAALHIFESARVHKKPGLQIAVGNYWMNNPYSLTKNTTERFAMMYNKEHGTDIRVCRGMNVFGERQKHRPIRKIFPNLAIPALLDKPITIYGDGEQVMDLIYAADIAEVLARITLADDIPNDIMYESGVGGGMTINMAVDMVLKAANSKSQVNHIPMRPGEEPGAVVEISEQGWKDLEQYVGYTIDDITPVEQAVQQSVDWYRDNLHRFPWDE
jgi:nucleoside-diphosphate-sugar epimerase